MNCLHSPLIRGSWNCWPQRSRLGRWEGACQAPRSMGYYVYEGVLNVHGWFASKWKIIIHCQIIENKIKQELVKSTLFAHDDRQVKLKLLDCFYRFNILFSASFNNCIHSIVHLCTMQQNDKRQLALWFPLKELKNVLAIFRIVPFTYLCLLLYYLRS